MPRDKNHNLLIWLLALMVVFAPMQAAVSAIYVFDHTKGQQQQHCKMDMADTLEHSNMGHSDMEHGDCCQHKGTCQDNCSTCTQHVSVQAMLFGHTTTKNKLIKEFIYLKTSLADGIPVPSEYRPPRYFS